MKKITRTIIPLMVALMAGISTEAQTVVSSVISLDTDDQEEMVADGSLDIASSDLELAEEGVTSDQSKQQLIGLRFQNVAVPQGAIIKSAYIQFTADNTNDEPTSLIFKGEAVDNAETFDQNSFAVSSRVTGKSEVKWSPAPWTVSYSPTADMALVRGEAQKSANIRSIIQEIVSRDGWVSENALAIIITGTGEREAESFEGANGDHANGDLAATLTIEYDMPTMVSAVIALDTDDQEEMVADGSLDIASSDLELAEEGVTSDQSKQQLIGLRFANLAIPQGAVITSAYVQFTADNTNDEETHLTIQAEATDNAETFAQTAFSVSSRPTGLAKVEWSPAPWTTSYSPTADMALVRGEAQKTANIASIVQEVVNRNGWVSGNALSLIITGTGEREAESFEGANGDHANGDLAATIIVNYTLPESIVSVVNLDTDDQEEMVADGSLDIASSDLELAEEGVTSDQSKQQLIGIRFTDIQIPQGAYITKAYIQFSADNTNDEPTLLTIKSEATDNAETFAQTSFSVSSRPTGNQVAEWSFAPWTGGNEQGENQRSGDISNVIQETINRAGWVSGNALAVIITGTGEREAESFEGANGDHATPSYAPTLHVEFAYTNAPEGSTKTGVAPVGSLPIVENAVWRYLDNGTDQGTAWTATNFDDATWKFGRAELGYGDGDETTLVSFGTDVNNKFTTTYFRHLFEVTEQEIASADSLEIVMLVDDGAILYLNGVEIVRENMPLISDFSTFAPDTIEAPEEGQYITYRISKRLLVAGLNCLAAEVHQANLTSTDISFKLTAEPKRYDLVLIPEKAAWNYNDSGIDLGAESSPSSFDDAAWSREHAVLGYGNGDETTTLSFGANAANKNITTYFRKKFMVEDTAGRTALQLQLKRDDGAVVYINGIEVYRNNMPQGPITNTSLAINFVEGGEEDVFVTSNLDKSVLVIGENTIAVEIHQNTATSTDLRFDLSLLLPADEVKVTYSGYNVNCEPSSSDHIACFTSVVPTEQQENFVIPKESHTFQLIAKALESEFTDGGKMPNGFDFTGFIPDNGSSTKGWLSINHENTPGGVSIVTLHLDETTGLWVVDSINAVDYSPVVQSIRNCSGGVTPWGTVISSEETYNTGDANNDGFQDVGWQVEIDPRTHSVVDHNNDGNPDKLWAMGRFSHENVVVSQDSLTAYEAEDGGTGGVYKFVANNKMDLSSGTLYVLKRDDVNPTTGTWVVVPNTTKEQMNTTRTLAASLGGTNWGGCEDVEIHPITGKVYFTEKGKGDTWRFTDNGTTVSDLEQFLSTQEYEVNHNSGTTLESWRTGNDNLAFDDEGNLWILQDGGRDYIWMAHADHTPENPHVEVFMTTAKGSEPTGMTFTPDFKYMFLSIQNPSGTNKMANIDVAGNEVVANSSLTLVISRKQFLGSSSLIPKLSLGADTTICVDEIVVKNIQVEDATVVVNGEALSTPELEISTADTYIVEAFLNNGKKTTDTLVVALSEYPVVDLGPDKEVLEGNTVTLDAGAGFTSYLWSNEKTTQTIEVGQGGTYTVTVANEFNCETTAEVYVEVISGLNDKNELLYKLSAYPNPFGSSSQVQFELIQTSNVMMEVFAVDGSKITTLTNQRMSAGTHNYTFTPSDYNLGAGMYLLKLTIDEKTSVLRMISNN